MLIIWTFISNMFYSWSYHLCLHKLPYIWRLLEVIRFLKVLRFRAVEYFDMFSICRVNMMSWRLNFLRKELHLKRNTKSFTNHFTQRYLRVLNSTFLLLYNFVMTMNFYFSDIVSSKLNLQTRNGNHVFLSWQICRFIILVVNSITYWAFAEIWNCQWCSWSWRRYQRSSNGPRRG